MTSPTVATCSTAEWTFNSLDQSPCFIASTIAQACSSDTNFALPPLPAGGGQHYQGPPATPGSATECRCNTAFYSLQSACALCQHDANDFLRWSEYATNCSATYEGLPVAVTSSVLIPAYAYLNVAINDTFNVALAQSPAFRDLDFTATSTLPMASTTTTPHSSAESNDDTHTSSHGDASESSLPTHSAIGNSDSTHPTSDSKTRAVVGGVVGTVCGLILIAGLIVYCLRRSRKKRILSMPLRAVDGVSSSTLPSHNASQLDGSDSPTDEKGIPQQPSSNPQAARLDGSDFVAGRV